MPIPAPTAEELKAKTEELAKTYLESMTEIMSSREKINEAVEYRAILIGDPSKGSNEDTLETVKHHFDERGNRRKELDKSGEEIKGKFYELHNPARAYVERQLLRPNDMSDRESIALVSAYFKAGVNMLGNSHGIIYASVLGDAVRTTISQELRDVAGFKNPGDVEDYSPRENMREKLESLKTTGFEELVNKIIANFNSFPKLKPKATELAIEAKKFAEGHLEKDIQKDPSSPKAAINKVKQDLLMRTNSALTEFVNTWNKDKLIIDMMEIKRDDDAREHGHGAGETSDIINRALSLATKGLNSKEKLSISQSLQHVGVFSSKSPSADTSPKPRSHSDDEKKSPRSPDSLNSPRSPK